MKLLIKNVLKPVLFAGLFLSQLANADIALQPGISGTWIIQGDGQGAMINIAEAGGSSVFVFTWYTYSNGQQAWMIGSAPFQANTTSISMPVEITNGSGFGGNFNSGDVNRTDWGVITLNFSSCDAGTMQYSSNLPEFGSGSLSLTRLTNTQGLTCQNQDVGTIPDPGPIVIPDPIVIPNPNPATLNICVDDYPQEACNLVDGLIPGASNIQFILGSSCSSSFPQHIYLPDEDPSTENLCSSNGLNNCGTCAFSVQNTANTISNPKSIDSNLIENIDYKGVLKSLNSLEE